MDRLIAQSIRDADRRACPRHYLTRPLRAELVYGRTRFSLDSGCVGNVSRSGLGLRTDSRVGASAGTIATVALAKDDKQVLTLCGEVVSVRNGIDLGIRLLERDLQRLGDWLGGGLDSTAITSPKNGLSQVSGKLSVASLHPLRWAVAEGANRLDLGEVTDIDSAGIALLLRLNEKSGVTVEACPPHVCRLLRLVAGSELCSGCCSKATLAVAV